MIKLMIAVKRRAGMTAEQFRQHLGEQHAALVLACPATHRFIRKYVQSYALEGVLPGDEASFDGAVELWFDDVGSMQSFFADPAYLADVRPDELRFADIDGSAFFVTEERQIL